MHVRAVAALLAGISMHVCAPHPHPPPALVPHQSTNVCSLFRADRSLLLVLSRMVRSDHEVTGCRRHGLRLELCGCLARVFRHARGSCCAFVRALLDGRPWLSLRAASRGICPILNPLQLLPQAGVHACSTQNACTHCRRLLRSHHSCAARMALLCLAVLHIVVVQCCWRLRGTGGVCMLAFCCVRACRRWPGRRLRRQGVADAACSRSSMCCAWQASFALVSPALSAAACVSIVTVQGWLPRMQSLCVKTGLAQ